MPVHIPVSGPIDSCTDPVGLIREVLRVGDRVMTDRVVFRGIEYNEPEK